jgi:L-alanine-DL-glutamate epimerase-like enolase superfamily enzyme
MIITEAKAWLEKLPLKKPYTISYDTFFDTRVVMLQITLDDGTIGIGSANPFEEVVGETPEQTLNLLQNEWCSRLLGLDINHFESFIDLNSSALYKNPGTLAAIDIALHDAWARLQGKPLANLLGKVMNGLTTSVTIGIKSPEDALAEGLEYVALGFTALKIKTGMDVMADIETVIRIRAAVGKSVQLRVDANAGYDIEALLKFYAATKEADVELIEQPLPAGEEDTLRKLPKTLRRMLVADESLTDIEAAQQLCRSPLPFGVFNIKLMKCGGIRAARKIAALAQLHNIPIFWGCNDESRASIAAALHTAYSCPGTRYLDLDGYLDLERDVVKGGFRLEAGKMFLTEEYGLGIYWNT